MEYWDKKIVLENLVREGIITLDRGRVISSIDLMNYPGDYPVYSSSAQRNGYFGSFDLYDFDEELITWSVDGGGYFFYRPKHKFSVTNVSGIMRVTKSEKFNYKFLYYLLVYQHKNQIFDYVDKAHPSVIKKRYFIPEIALKEQTQIATILSKIDEAISQTEQLIAKYTRIKTGLMQDLLTKGIDEHGNIRSEQTHEFKDSPLGRIPKEWEVKRLDQMTKPNSPIVYGILMPGKHFFGGIPVVKVKDIFDEKIHFEDLLFTNPIIANSFKRSELMKDDLLFTIRGTVGRCAFVPKELEGANITQDTARIRVRDKYKEYVRYAFETPDSRFYIQLNTIGQAVKGINLKALRELSILVPSPTEAQLIAKELNTANSFLSVEALKQRKLQSLKTGLMQDLLSGKVRVNHLIKKTASV